MLCARSIYPLALLGVAAAGCNFNITLTGVQCFGLSEAPAATTAASCSEACCALETCNVWEFCPTLQCVGAENVKCWIGSADLSTCKAQPTWSGAARVIPPPPPPPPESFSVPLPAALPLVVVDLASSGPADAAWSVSIDGSPARSIVVPGGGYNSDEQASPFINSAFTAESAVYTRSFQVPASPAGVVTIEFGAVNYGAEIYVGDGKNGTGALVGVHLGPNMPFAVDISNVTSPGGFYALTVVSHPFPFYAGAVPSAFTYAETWTNPPNGWSSRTPNGISKYVRVVIHPEVRFEELATACSVANSSLEITAVLRNHGPSTVTVNLTGTLSSWNGASWPYPPLPETLVTLGPGKVSSPVRLVLPWLAPPASWWWPNRPYSAAYVTQLHWLNLTAAGAGGPAAQASMRFGFVQHAEGPFYYTVNGVRINQLSDATPEPGMSYYDAYTSAAYFPAAAAADTWSRYMRVGMTSNRIHQSTPTQEMMDAADEIGFLIKPESPIRGCPGYETCKFGPVFTQSVTELLRWCVVAYSIENESDGDVIPALIDAAALADPSRPLTTEGSGSQPLYNGTGAIPGAHALNMLHYEVPPPEPPSSPYIRGVGESAWCVPNGMESFSSLALAGRLADVAYYAGWDWINYWPNFLTGMNASRHAWHQAGCNGTDRVDGVDGWGSPVLDWVQRAFHPFLAADLGAIATNPIFSGPGWPYITDAYTYGSGSNVTREVALFNDVAAGTERPWDASGPAHALSLLWTTAWDAANGTAAGPSGGWPLLPVAPGFRAAVNVTFPVPDPGPGAPPDGRRLFVVLSVLRPASAEPGVPVYVEDRVYVRVQQR